ncbi:ABC transporter substrate-binding protein [Xylophilus rhododendri]|uniref:ABC transporter substrate-binding protein n=1 Tax=Xylophilus rhododendri TaxID=2697032 RepID=A0A857J3V8_9BURK|nr:tripartite tricarboxylate transporter substrate binding protein [Xylophilus rhododendri]QHI97731.1 ABC transporter substrate-binding protein [Xylophilus rhododendri]
MPATDRRSLLLLAALAVAAAPALAAEAFPNHAIKIIVPFAPGGTTDILARIMADGMARYLGQSIVVDNRAGAAGAIGSEAVVRAAPDGYTLGIATVTSHSVLPLTRKLNYDVRKDLLPVVNIANCPTVWSAGMQVPAKNLTEFIALAKANPGRYSFGSSGAGGGGHLKMEMFQLRTGTQLLHVPYKGISFVIQDVLAGQVDVLSDDLPSSLPYIQGGKLKALAVSGNRRVPSLPDVPTYAEQGLPELGLFSWFGIVAPASTPPEVIARLNKAANDALAEPRIREAIEKLSVFPAGGTPQDFGKTMEDDRTSQAALLKAVNVKLD